MKKYMLILLVLIITNFVFAVKVSDMQDLLKPDTLWVDGDDLFIVERASYSIHVYSLSTLELKYKLGSKGEGPQEFTVWPYIADITPNYILAFGWNKGIWFSRDGKMIKEILLKSRQLHSISAIKDNYTALELFYDRQTGIAGWTIFLLDPQFEKIKELEKIENALHIEFTNQDRSKVKAYLILPVIAKSTYDDKIFLGNTKKGFYFDVFDQRGKHLYSIDKTDQVEKIEVDDAYEKKLLDYIRVNKNDYYQKYNKNNFVFASHLPAFKSFLISDNKIFVVTYKEKDGLREMIVLDLNGNILSRIFLPLKSVRMHRWVGEDTYTVYKGILYELVENDDTDMWEFHKTDLSTIKK